MKHTDCNTSHDKDLRAVAQQDTQEKRALGTAENIAVDQLPPGIFLDAIFDSRGAIEILQIDRVKPIITRNVLLQRTKENHADHSDKEEDKHGRIDQGEPVDLWVKDVEIFIPASSPRGIGLPPVNAVRPSDPRLILFAENHRRSTFAAVHLTFANELGIASGVWLDEDANHS